MGDFPYTPALPIIKEHLFVQDRPLAVNVLSVTRVSYVS